MKVIERAYGWFEKKGWSPFPFQQEAWNSYLDGKNGLVNAPTGSGKTYSLLVPALMTCAEQEDTKGLRIIWITPIRALAKEIFISARRLVEENELNLEIGIRTGDTPISVRERQKKNVPQLLITTPESLHVMMASKGYDKTFKKLDAVVVDEWHDLLGSKRGVALELALSHLIGCSPNLRIWGISATIGNLEESLDVLLGERLKEKGVLIRSGLDKPIVVESIMPDEIELMPWSGHLGVKMIKRIVPIIARSKSTLIFTNTRSQCEIWYQRLLHEAPDLAGAVAMHHGSISRELRYWVEDALYDGRLKAVVCTSSLDLGVDFRPVETIIQIGGPKGVARFVQRAGRSGHQPGAQSHIYFLPTHSLELIEAAALREAVKSNYLEDREPYYRSFDVLIQYMTTLAVSDGFDPDQLYEEVSSTFSFSSISEEEWRWCLRFITSGGASLKAYPEFRKAEVIDGLYRVVDRRIARRHRMSIGTIVSDPMVMVKFERGPNIGSIEDRFISSIKPGETFWFTGRNLELIQVKDLVATVKSSNRKTGKTPAWGGGRLPLSSKMSDMLRSKLTELMEGEVKDVELLKIAPLIELQKERSHVPTENEILIEMFETTEGHHLLMYPFEGRFVHEGIASLMAYRMSLLNPISFSIAFNDYGFELLSDEPIPLQSALDNEVFSTDYLLEDVQAGINGLALARRKFSDIAQISGMIFKGYPGKPVKERHLQSSSDLIFDVFTDYDSENLLYRQAFDEVIHHQLEMTRFRRVLERINRQKMIIKTPDTPTPFSFPIMADRFRWRLTSESVEDRIEKFALQYSEK